MTFDLEIKLLKTLNVLIGELVGNDASHVDLFEAIVQYTNLRDRIPSGRKWIVFHSSFLRKQILALNTSDGLDKFVAAAESGEDLRPWLHDGIFENLQDALMNDWGIQHYHLGVSFQIKSSKRKMISRTRELLYAIHNEDSGKLYLIGIFDHYSFSDKQLLEIVSLQWPELLAFAKLENVIGLSHSPSNSEIHQLRKNSINTAVEVNGEIFLGPGGGFMASGHSEKAVMKAVTAKKALREIQKEIDCDQLSVRIVVRDRSIYLLDETNKRHCLIV